MLIPGKSRIVPGLALLAEVCYNSAIFCYEQSGY